MLSVIVACFLHIGRFWGLVERYIRQRSDRQKIASGVFLTPLCRVRFWLTCCHLRNLFAINLASYNASVFGCVVVGQSAPAFRGADQVGLWARTSPIRLDLDETGDVCAEVSFWKSRAGHVFRNASAF